MNKYLGNTLCNNKIRNILIAFDDYRVGYNL